MLKNLILRIFLSLALLSILPHSAVQAQIDGEALALMKGVKVDKAAVKQMLDLMEQSGQISKEMADKARSELDKKSDSEIQALQEVAIQKLEKGENINLPAANASTNSAVTPTSSKTETSTVTAPAVNPTATSAASPADKAEKSEEELKNALQFLNSK